MNFLMFHMCFLLLVCNTIGSKTKPPFHLLFTCLRLTWSNLCMRITIYSIFVHHDDLQYHTNAGQYKLVAQASKLPLKLHLPIHGFATHCVYCVESVLRIRISYGIQYLCLLLMCYNIQSSLTGTAPPTLDLVISTAQLVLVSKSWLDFLCFTRSDIQLEVL